MIGFLNCKFWVVHNYKGTKKKKISFSKEALFEKGREHEKNYLNKVLKKKYKNVVEIKGGSEEEKLKKTIKAIENGADVVYQGLLLDNDWKGQPDFLIKQSDSKSYEVVDTKISTEAKVNHVMQIASYTELLAKKQNKVSKKMHLVLKNNETVSYSTTENMAYFSINKERFEKFLKTDFIKNTKPQKCSFCQFCDYKDACREIWKKNDSINLIANIERRDIRKLENDGIYTIKQVANLGKKKVNDLKESKLSKIQKQAELQIHKESTGENRFHKLPIEIFRGFNRLPKKGSCDLFFDIESVPDYLYEDGLEYLFGLHFVENGKPKSKFFWAHNRKEEKKMLIDFMDFVIQHLKKYSDSYIFHYHNYEKKALEDLTSVHKSKIKELDDLLRLEKFVDLFKAVKESLLLSVESYSLKDIECFYDFKRKGSVQTAEDSVDYYLEFMETQDKKILKKIEEYNDEDIQSTMHLRNWLYKIRPEELPWFKPSKEEVEEKEWENDNFEMENKIKESNINENLKIILSDIMTFHRRENRPDWWFLRDRRFKNVDELIEDPECIGGMKMIGTPSPIKQSLLYTYKFPEQEYKRKIGDKPIDAHWQVFEEKGAGEIIELDEKKKILKIKKGIKKGKTKLPPFLNLGPPAPIRPDKLEYSIKIFIQDIIDNKNKYKALLSILLKEYPKIKNIKKGADIISSENFEKEIPNTISNLENSYLVIQGPPGTGKTYQAANAILELIRNKKKIGVTGHSHKVIHNLLKAVEEANEKKNIEFKGLKKKGSRDEDVFNGKFISTPEGGSDRPFLEALKHNSHSLFAGTVYHFSNNFYDQQLDVLFIDESSQVSIADVCSMGRCAKNLVLVGDSQQLAMPIRAKHPGDSGKSCLDYLIDQDTISKNKGVFLNMTRRLTPNINLFISENFYDGRLKFHPITEKRKIIFTKKEKIFNKPGIYYLPMDHKDNSQLSEEEGKVVCKLYDKFLKAKFIDEFEVERNFKIQDILCISPYNVQVNYLKSILPKQSAIGTIDRFQGQQAPVTIISMTSSDTNNLTRNLEFFYSRNRLNVAISRSQVMSIILMNSELFHFQCKKTSQIKLVNTLVKLDSYKVNNYIV